MSTLETNTIAVLNRLIETLKDGEQGFEAAADRAQSPELRSLLRDYATERAQFAIELQALARSLGETEPEDSGSMTGAMHRGWIDFKSLFTGKDDLEMLAECQRGEESAVDRYREELDHPELPENIRQVILRQFGSIQIARDRIRNLYASMEV